MDYLLPAWVLGGSALGLQPYFHSLRNIPRPRLAAMTSCFEFYYDVLSNGLYLLKIKEMHEANGKHILIPMRRPIRLTNSLDSPVMALSSE